MSNMGSIRERDTHTHCTPHTTRARAGKQERGGRARASLEDGSVELVTARSLACVPRPPRSPHRSLARPIARSHSLTRGAPVGMGRRTEVPLPMRHTGRDLASAERLKKKKRRPGPVVWFCCFPVCLKPPTEDIASRLPYPARPAFYCYASPAHLFCSADRPMDEWKIWHTDQLADEARPPLGRIEHWSACPCVEYVIGLQSTHAWEDGISEPVAVPLRPSA